MTTKEMLKALKPYAPGLAYSVVIRKWYVTLYDWDCVTFYARDIDAALRKALKAVKVTT